MNKLESLQLTLDAASIPAQVTDFDLSFPDSDDTPGARGARDLAALIAESVLTPLFDSAENGDEITTDNIFDTRDELREIILNLLDAYKTKGASNE